MLRPTAAALFAFTAATLALPAYASVPTVDVRIPVGLTSDFPTTARAADGDLYVTIPSLRVTNPNASDFGPYDPSQFHLLAGDRIYTPIVRPGLGAIDLSTSGIVRPGGTLITTVSFEVPAATTRANFEFIPHWFDNNGASVAFCCYYL